MWLVGKPSVLSISPSLAHLLWKSAPELDVPDLEYVFTPASFREGVVGLLDKSPGMTLGVWQTRPESKGYVKIVSRDIFEHPEINPNYLAEGHDQRVLLRSMRLGRELLSTAPLQPFLEGCTSPSVDLQTDDEFLDWARQNGITVYHMMARRGWGPIMIRRPLWTTNFASKASIACASLTPPSCPSCHLATRMRQR